MNVADIQVFSRVAGTSSFSAAAAQLGITRSAVSRAVARIESQLGVTLLNRSPRSVSLTEAGRTFYEHCRDVDDALDRAIASVSGADQRASGVVVCSLPTSLGAVLVEPLMSGFRAAWPDIELNLHFDDTLVDLVGTGIDVAIRIAPKLDDSSLLSRRIGRTRQVLAASPAYLARAGTPQCLADLRAHRCLALNGNGRQRTTWRFADHGGPVEIAVPCATTSNSQLALVLAACMDDGIVCMPELLIASELRRGLLRRVLPGVSAATTLGIFAVSPNQRPAAKVRALIDFIERELPQLEESDGFAGPRPLRPLRDLRKA